MNEAAGSLPLTFVDFPDMGSARFAGEIPASCA